ncbi:aminoacyl-tRNA hydrolase [Clostridium sp. AM58-1XD]|uniref:aminoacyl-tRNA hydrolase n=1 Tax=Clostridium sp. AM58-1XD TaxID=2292307 RepID=UPI000E4BE3C7|nr:aminoacyl-tRNA hydrolase [Clostridium sp. AM58-1XD]RGY96267.1 aminoacyl-tRNA hydrolase [Clostridium sp. AM58-1XD]
MYLIAGLGNPTKQYEGTRHNAGFSVIDVLAGKLGISVNENKHKGLIGRGMAGSEKVILLKPQTFMNLSGESVRAVSDFYKIEPENIIIIYDDIDLAPGHLRVRAKGSAGGHNGIKSIIAHLGTQEFPRVRVGVGAKPDRMDLADYVLGRFPQVEKQVMEDAFEAAAQAAVTIVEEGTDTAMNRFNGRK